MPNVDIMPLIRNQYLDDNGDPYSGGKIYTYSAGTSTLKTTYQDANGLVAHENPIVLDSGGRATVYLESSAAYKIVLKNSDDETVWTEDGVSMSSLVTSVETMDDLKALTPGATTYVRTLGYHTINDKGGWIYYWDSTSTDTPDDGMVIQDDGLSATGRWIGLTPSDGQLNCRVYGCVCDGSTDDVSELQACDTYCAANGLIILIDSSIKVDTDPTLTSKIYLLPSAQFRYGTFNPTIPITVDIHDNTQHFNCAIGQVPTLQCSFVLPEWFGETSSSHAKTTACLAASASTRKVLFTGIVGTANAEME